MARAVLLTSLHVKGCRAGGAEFHRAHADTGHSNILCRIRTILLLIQTLKCYDRNLNAPEGLKRPPGFLLVLILFAVC